MPATQPEAVPVIRDVIDSVYDRNKMAAGISACRDRASDFSSPLEMELAGIAMVPAARDLMTEKLTEYWDNDQRSLQNINVSQLADREVIIGAGFHAAVYAASRVQMGFPKPVVLERGTGTQVGGAFAVSHRPVFRLNSRTRPGPVGLPDQDKALNYIPGGLLQPSMMTSEEYMTNADMAWLIRLTLAQYATVVTNAEVTSLSSISAKATVTTTDGTRLTVGRALDARGTGDPKGDTGEHVLSFPQLMARMGGVFPLRGMQQVTVRGGGDSARCALESLLGIAPGHSSAMGLDYVTRVDWYTGDSGGTAPTCSEFREGQRGRYIRLAQYLEGNVSNPSTRLRAYLRNGYATPMPDGVIVNDRTYDLMVDCTGYSLPALDKSFSYSAVRYKANTTVLAKQANPLPLFQIGPAADIAFSEAEQESDISANPANKVAMFRLAPRTAGLAATLPALS